jgi:hypothetical protein
MDKAEKRSGVWQAEWSKSTGIINPSQTIKLRTIELLLAWNMVFPSEQKSISTTGKKSGRYPIFGVKAQVLCRPCPSCRVEINRPKLVGAIRYAGKDETSKPARWTSIVFQFFPKTNLTQGS